MSQLTATQTNSTPAAVAGAFVWAYRQLFGKAPNKTDWLFPLAQSALETAHWQGGLWNWNVGNLTTTGADYILLPGLTLHFKSYDTLGDGCVDMLRWLNSHGAMSAADDGDLDAYIAALRAGGYLGRDDGSAKMQTEYDNYRARMAGNISRYSNLNPAGYINLPSTRVMLTAALVAGGVAWLWHTGELSTLLDEGRATVRRTFKAA